MGEYKETAVFLIPKEHLAFMKDDKGVMKTSARWLTIAAIPRHYPMIGSALTAK